MAVRRNMKFSLPRMQRGLTRWIIVLVVLALFPVIGIPHSWLLYIFLFFIYLAMANMWNLLAGYSGLIMLCPAAFIGLAGYTMTILTWPPFNMPVFVGVIAGGIVAALFAALISIPVFRLRGIYFAIGTLVVPEILRVIFLLWRPVGGALHGGGAGYMVKGVTGITMTEVYWFALVIGFISIFLMRYILRSKLGLGLAAIRDNDVSASSTGINIFNVKLTAFAIAAFVMGIAGCIFYIFQGYIEPSSAYGIRWLLTCLLATVIGGEGIEEGPILGTIVVVFLHFFLARYAGISLLIQGVILIIIMLFLPQGILGAIRGIRGPGLLSRLRLASRSSNPGTNEATED